MEGEGWSDCARRGLAVKAVKGNALLFYSLKPNGEEDSASTHGSCPTLAGEKWSATRWGWPAGRGLCRARQAGPLGAAGQCWSRPAWGWPAVGAPLPEAGAQSPAVASMVACMHGSGRQRCSGCCLLEMGSLSGLITRLQGPAGEDAQQGGPACMGAPAWPHPQPPPCPPAAPAARWIHVGPFQSGGTSKGCQDDDEKCEEWAVMGECESGPDVLPNRC